MLFRLRRITPITWGGLMLTLFWPSALVWAQSHHGEIPTETQQSPLQSKVAESPPPKSGQVVVHRNLPYKKYADGSEGPDRLRQCDVYLPAGSPSPQGYPTVVVVHGGAWISGDKWTLEGYSRQLAEQGIASVTINYRLAPKDKFPSQVDDVREALLWIAKMAKQYRFDLEHLGMFGYSAGGHLSLLVAALADEPISTQATASFWKTDDARWQQLPKIIAVCAGGPPCDFRSLPIDNTTLSYFLGGSRREKSETYTAASPIVHVSRGDPVTQIFHGAQDLIVPVSGAQAFHRAQLAAGITSQLITVPRQGHVMTFLNPKSQQHVVRFFAKNFAPTITFSP